MPSTLKTPTLHAIRVALVDYAAALDLITIVQAGSGTLAATTRKQLARALGDSATAIRAQRF